MTLNTGSDTTRGLMSLKAPGESASRRICRVQLGTQHHLRRAWVIRKPKPNHERRIGTANTVNNSKPPKIVTTLKPQMCTQELITICKNTLKLLATNKQVSSGDKAFASLSMNLSGSGAPSHVAVTLVAGVATLNWFSCPIEKDGTVETLQIHLSFSGRTGQSDPSCLV